MEHVHYRIIPGDPAGHLFEIELTVPAPDPGGQVLSLPAWIPGSYMIRDFARNIVTLTASCAGAPVGVEKLDKQTWRCAPCLGPLRVSYQVYAWDLSVRAAHLDTTHGYFNGTSVFLRVHGREHEPSTVAIRPPEGAAYGRWRVATTLPRDGAAPYGFGAYRAGDYEELVDHPVEMGEFTLVEFQAGGIPHGMAITGRRRADTDRLAHDLKRLCEFQIGLFGPPPPMDRYLFLVTAVGDGYGGLEHRASCSLVCKRDDLPLPGRDEVANGYRGFLGLCSHEYFHSWHIKRIKPAAFIPYDLDREVHTTLLWAFEGFTAYYDDLILARSGLIKAQSYLELLGQTITRVLRGSGRHRQSVADSSFDAWTKFYKQDENAPNAIVSYYAKGSLIALCLDLMIHCDSGGERSLDDVMRALWNRYGKTGTGVGESDLEPLIAEFGGEDLKDFLDQAVRGTADLPLAEQLARVGIELNLRPAESREDKGGKPASTDGARLAHQAALGVRTAEHPGGARLENVFSSGAAHRAGLAAGDVVIAVDGLRTDYERLQRMIGSFAPGTRIRLHAFRRDELMDFEVELQPPPADTCFLTQREGCDEAIRTLRTGWLGAGTKPKP